MIYNIYEHLALVLIIVTMYPVTILWCNKILKPFYIFLNSKVEKPFYDGVSNIMVQGHIHGKYNILNTFLNLLPITFLLLILPNCSILGPYNYKFLVFMYCAFIPSSIMDLHDHDFYHTERILDDEKYLLIKNFSSEGYSYHYYSLLSTIIMIICIIFGVFSYLNTFQFRFIVLMGIYLIIILMTTFPEITDKIMPFDMKTKKGYTIFIIIAIMIVFISLHVIYKYG